MDGIKQVNISLNKVDYEKLTCLMVAVKELNRSAFVRSLIERAWEEQQAKQKTEEAKK